MGRIDELKAELIQAVLDSEEYREYKRLEAEVSKNADLKRAIDEFRRRNFEIQYNDEIQEIYRDSLQGKNADVFFKSQRVLESPPRPEYNEILGAFTDIAEEYLLQNITFEEAEARLEAKRQELYAR